MSVSSSLRLLFHPAILEADTRTLRFCYEHVFADGKHERYEERLVLAADLWNETRLQAPETRRLLTQLSLGLGLSYWKMYCPSELVPPTPLTSAEADAWNTIYRDALGEFFFRNQLDPYARQPFVGTETTHAPPSRTTTSPLAIVPFGGGKDSLLTLHLLQTREIPCRAFTLGTSIVQEQGLRAFQTPVDTITRTLDAEMIRKSKAGEAYNGHVSITLIYALTASLVALLRDARYVVFSNESSASEANIEWRGMAINHQWSKSWEAEQLIRSLIETSVAPDLSVFSLLRPLTEVGIVERVARLLPHLFGSFSSCNKNFTIASARPHRKDAAYWCGTCPKCAFVGLLFAPFISRAALERLIGSNPLNNPDLIPLYRDLLGLGSLKPFECVGTFEETRACFAALAHHPEYQDLVVVRWFSEQASIPPSTPALDTLLAPLPSAVKTLPTDFQTLL